MCMAREYKPLIVEQGEIYSYSTGQRLKQNK
jgi:hypothetical protein